MKKLLIFIFNIFIFLNIFAYDRIASLNLSSDEMLLGLVEKDKIVGLSSPINQDKDMSNVINEAKNFPTIQKNLEVLLNLEPDLVIAPDWMDKKFIQSVKDSNIKIYLYKTPKNLEEQEKLILDLGKFLNANEKAQNIVKDMQKRAKIMNEKTKNLKFTPRVMLYTAFETTSDENTSFNDLVKINNAINPVVGSGITSFDKISKEKLIELNPDIIIVPTWETYVDNNKFFSYLLDDPSLKEINAIKNKHVFNIPYKDISPTSQYMINGVEKMGDIILEVAK